MVRGSRATSVTGGARGSAVAGDWWENGGRRVAIGIVLADAQVAGTTAKEIGKDRLSRLWGRLWLVCPGVHGHHKRNKKNRR